MNTPSPSSARRDLPDAPLLAALRGETPSRRPVWFMRQAGRSLPEYREVRAGIPMLDACMDPALVAEITMQPVRRHDVDAAILFSDIVVPLRAAGVDLDIVPGVGPVVAAPVRTIADVEVLPAPAGGALEPVAEAIRRTLPELGDRQALIGFAGAPFTLASYLIEGGPSRNHLRTKALMHGEPTLWHRLMERLEEIVVDFLEVQIGAGIDAWQLFDSWAGALSQRDYREFVLPHSRSIIERLAPHGLPSIHFGVGTGELLGAMSEAGTTCVGVDWRVPLDEAAVRTGHRVALQGNLDPAVLVAPTTVLEAEIDRICGEADRALAAGTPGHVFNLGHGVLPETEPAAITTAVRLVHER